MKPFSLKFTFFNSALLKSWDLRFVYFHQLGIWFRTPPPFLFSCWLQSFPQKISRMLCLGSASLTLSFLDLGGGISERPWSASPVKYLKDYDHFGPVIFVPKISSQNTLFCPFCSKIQNKEHMNWFCPFCYYKIENIFMSLFCQVCPKYKIENIWVYYALLFLS